MHRLKNPVFICITFSVDLMRICHSHVGRMAVYLQIDCNAPRIDFDFWAAYVKTDIFSALRNQVGAYKSILLI
jgi:hypothetical protein